MKNRLLALTGALVLIPASSALAASPQTLQVQLPGMQNLGVPIEILMALTVLSLAPAVLILMTSFTRIVVVLSFIRTALGTQNIPPTQVIVGLSLFLTFFVMQPTFAKVNTAALQPYLQHRISITQAYDRGIQPLRTFMMDQTNEKDIGLMMHLAHLKRPKSPAQVPTYVLIPSFVVSELGQAFKMAFILYLPFLIIDLVVASTLMSLGMMMLPPVLVSLPFKLLLFVLVGGWQLIVQSLIQSYH